MSEIADVLLTYSWIIVAVGLTILVGIQIIIYMSTEDERVKNKQREISHICDDICKYSSDNSLTQKQLDELCENCVVNNIAQTHTNKNN